jgi:membrane-associated phospholipid phosphatase
MDWFAPAVFDHRLENRWIVWDRWLLDTAGLRAGIESLGPVGPFLFELCYLLVYAVGPVAITAVLFNGGRRKVDRLWFAYLAGTLSTYALFPYFPSEPPRSAFPNMDLPHVVTVFRSLNLFIVGGYGIHSSVFPSAHVSSALSAGWGLLATLPKNRRWIGWCMAAYGFAVAIATIYGRYHYLADAIAGTGMSMLALLAIRATVRKPLNP